MSKENEKDLQRLMEHPVFVMHDGSAKIIRAQLFFLSVSTILLVLSGIAIGEGSSILGIRLEGLTLQHILLVLSCLLFYQMLHFLWASWESFCEWRLRQSALDAGGWGRGGIQIVDENQSLKVRQHTLYSFLSYVLEPEVQGLKKKIDALDKDDFEKTYSDIDKSVQQLCEIFRNPRIDDALWRFDNWFKMFCRTQNWRWFLLEVSLPLVLGVFAIALAGRRVLELSGA